MNAAQDMMDVIQMQHARILLVHTPVNAKVDIVVMELTAQVCHLVVSGGISTGTKNHSSCPL